jgi:hypothetical protein
MFSNIVAQYRGNFSEATSKVGDDGGADLCC